MIFEMISLKWIKLLTNFCWLKTNLYPNCIQGCQDLLNRACALFFKHQERIKKFGEKGSLKRLYKNVLEKACFAHGVAYSDSKDLGRELFQIRF